MTGLPQTILNSGPNPVYVVDGHEDWSPDSCLTADGRFPPFHIFMPGVQDYLPGAFDTRDEAEAVTEALLGAL